MLWKYWGGLGLLLFTIFLNKDFVLKLSETLCFSIIILFDFDKPLSNIFQYPELIFVLINQINNFESDFTQTY